MVLWQLRLENYEIIIEMLMHLVKLKHLRITKEIMSKITDETEL